jgi:hypothetical protein
MLNVIVLSVVAPTKSFIWVGICKLKSAELELLKKN